eukprot:756884-Pleurochrysis_carterae.AAC.3
MDTCRRGGRRGHNQVSSGNVGAAGRAEGTVRRIWGAATRGGCWRFLQLELLLLVGGHCVGLCDDGHDVDPLVQPAHEGNVDVLCARAARGRRDRTGGE